MVVSKNHENQHFLYSQACTGGKDSFNLYARHIALSDDLSPDWLIKAPGGPVRTLCPGRGPLVTRVYITDNLVRLTIIQTLILILFVSLLLAV